LHAFPPSLQLVLRPGATCATWTGLLLLALGLWACSGSEAPADRAGRDGDEAIETTAERGPVRFTVRAASGELTVGEKLTLTLEVEAAEGVEIRMPRPDSPLGPFEIRQAYTPPDVPEGDVRRWTHHYILDTFASGALEIPSLQVGYTDRRPESLEDEKPIEGELSSQPLLVTVASVLAGDEQDTDYRDIKEAVDVPIARDWPEYWPLAAAGIVIICVAFLLLVRRARRRGIRAAQPPIILPHVWALSQLDLLAREELIEQGRFHAFYFRLSDIVRQYIERRFGIMAPERTTEEFFREAKRDSSLSDEHKDLLRGFLRAADMVKFALHEPSVDESRRAFEAARGFVEQTVPMAGGPGERAGVEDHSEAAA
jgi:hypothetical protein